MLQGTEIKGVLLIPIVKVLSKPRTILCMFFLFFLFGGVGGGRAILATIQALFKAEIAPG